MEKAQTPIHATSENWIDKNNLNSGQMHSDFLKWEQKQNDLSAFLIMEFYDHIISYMMLLTPHKARLST